MQKASAWLAAECCWYLAVCYTQSGCCVLRPLPDPQLGCQPEVIGGAQLIATANSTFGSLTAGTKSTVCAVNCFSYSKGKTVQAGPVRQAQKAARQNQLMLTELQLSALPRCYFGVT